MFLEIPPIAATGVPLTEARVKAAVDYLLSDPDDYELVPGILAAMTAEDAQLPDSVEA